MKKIIGIVTFISIISCTLIAQEITTENLSITIKKQQALSETKISHLLNNHLLFENETEIFALSKNLTQTQKYYIYDRYKESVLTPAALNFFVGFGIGSFIQGDKKTGCIAAGGELISLSVLAFSYYYIITQSYYYTDGLAYEQSFNIPGSDMNTIAYVALASYVALMGFRCFEVISPFIYTKKYNTQLENSLGLNDTNVNLSLVPKLNNNGSASLALAFNFKL